MERIVQLTDYEYDLLKSQANATREEIKKQIQAEVEKNCNIKVELKMEVGRNQYDHFYIQPYASMIDACCGNHPVMDFDATYKLARRIQKWMKSEIEHRYGFGVKQVNKYIRANKNRWKWTMFYGILAASGWAVATCLWFFK